MASPDTGGMTLADFGGDVKAYNVYMMSDVLDIEKVYNCPEILSICQTGRLPSYSELEEFMPEELYRVYPYAASISDTEDTESDTDSDYTEDSDSGYDETADIGEALDQL